MQRSGDRRIAKRKLGAQLRANAAGTRFTTGDPLVVGVAAGRGDSWSRDLERLPNDVLPRNVVLGQLAVRFEDELCCFREVPAGLIQRRALRVCTREFLDEPDVPLRDLSKHRGDTAVNSAFMPTSIPLRQAWQSNSSWAAATLPTFVGS
jgi:hypothetical protein